jgi:Spy/CpxP family protein refolding chaperone
MANNKARREATALVFLVFVLGVVFGGVSDHLWRVRAASEQPPNTKPTRNEVMNDLTQRLQLTSDQQKRIGVAIDDTRAKWQALYAPLDAPRERIRQEGRANIRAVLTPEQQVKLDDFLKRLDEQRKKNAAAAATAGH